ncbi:MAG: DedA family protein [Verrucomicrobiia bacterium]|jgi:membrane protein DedA with SNARE-associated domain
MIIRRHWLLGLAFVLTVAITGVSAVRTARKVVYWRSHMDEPIHGWMTVGYIAHSYHVPPDVLYEALALPPKLPDKRPISKIARSQRHSVDDVIGVLADAIIHARAVSAATTRGRTRAMNVRDPLLAALAVSGYPVLFGVTAISSVGVPFPMTFMLIGAGSLVAQEEMNLWWVLVLASGGAVLGDQIGYGLARWGGRRLAHKLGRKYKVGEASLKKAEAVSKKWGGTGVFFSRWLVTPLGPWLNVTYGITEYPWHRFLLWSVLGEVLWVAPYVLLGKLFSDRVQALSETLGNLTWVIIGLLASFALGWTLWTYLRAKGPGGHHASHGSG